MIYSAYELIARDRAGMSMVDVEGELEWMGNDAQWHEADFQELYFLENGHFPETGNFF